MIDLVYSVPYCILWIMMIAAGYFRLAASSAAIRAVASVREWSIQTTIVVVALVAAVVRLVPAILLPRGAVFDIQSYSVVANLVLSHRDVYSSPEALGRYPYLPLQMYFSALSRFVADRTSVPFVVWTKITPILADILITVIIFNVVKRRRGTSHGFLFAMLYALNPVSILVSAYHGQFDSVPLLFILMAWWYLESSDPRSNWTSWIVGLLLGVAILDKTWPVLLIPAFVLGFGGFRRPVLFAVGIVVPSLAACVLYALMYWTSPVDIVVTAMSYRSAVGRWGFTALLSLYSPSHASETFMAGWIGPVCILALAGCTLLVSRKTQDRLGLIVITILAFYVATAGFSVQYLVWIVPFAILAGQIRQLMWFVGSASIFLLIAYFGYEITPILPEFMTYDAMLTVLRVLSLPVWIVTGAWLIENMTGVVALPSAVASSSWRRLRPSVDP